MAIRRSAAIYPDVATLQAQPGHRLEHYAVILANGQLYRWAPDNETAADGYGVVTHNGGYPGRWLAVAGDTLGADLANANADITGAGKLIRRIPAATLTADRTYTFRPTGVPVGAVFTVLRLDTEPHSAILVNGGPGAGTIVTLPPMQQWSVDVRFDGTNFALLRAGQLP